MDQEPKPEARVDRTPEGDASLEQVRDLLFGRQMRDSTERVERVEARLAQELSGLRSDTRQRLDALEKFSRRELEGLAKRIAEDKAERGAEQESFARELRETANAIGRRLDEAREESAQAARNLHDEILALSKNLSDDFAQRIEEHSGATDSALREIRRRMIDKSTLSSLFAELALELGEPGGAGDPAGDGEPRA